MLSIILLSYNSNENLRKVCASITSHMKEAGISFELVIVDDGSFDNSVEIAKDISITNDCVSVYQLSKNYTSHYAIFAGLSVVKGECAVAIPDDFQVPINTIIEMYRVWEKGHKIVIPFREKREDRVVSRALSNLYYYFMNKLSDINFPKGGADIFLADREIINIINNHISRRNTSSIIEVLRLGFDPVFIPFDRQKSINKKSRWTNKKKFKLALDTFISSSSFPIKLISIVGVLSFLLSISLIGFYTFIKLTGQINVPGWTLLVIIISFFSGLTLLSLGIIAEYMWRIFEEVKGRPEFIIKKEVNRL